jgi:hypothetical protein
MSPEYVKSYQELPMLNKLNDILHTSETQLYIGTLNCIESFMRNRHIAEYQLNKFGDFLSEECM